MHLYIHIPFCQSKCHYCSFTSLNKKNYEKAYFKALLEDLKFQFDFFKLSKNSLNTLFIGGGTPSVIEAKFYEELFIFLAPYLNKNSENTIEANPNSANLEWLKNMKEFGINRISFGAQSFHSKKLEFLGRTHTQKELFESVENAKKSGFKNINIDLIYDTKLDDKKMLDFELLHLKKIKKLLTHISAYHLSIEKNTAFANFAHYKKNAPRLMKYFIGQIENLGFKQYEISNFGRVCKHNLAYWQGKDYIGCGLSAVGFLKNQRFYTTKNLKTYIANPIFREVENLSLKELHLERLFLGFRSKVGVSEKILNPTQLQKAKELVNCKKLEFKNNRFYNPNFLISDELALYLEPS
ncbi:MAG: coproporphyrinogen III oxidase family protein [Campylobacter sp.]|nr:coproporphyrinogen III oxidase family protein [Campylobacter sp.]